MSAHIDRVLATLAGYKSPFPLVVAAKPVVTAARVLAMAAAVVAGSAQAGMTTDDAWAGHDKNMHFGAGVLIGSGMTLATGSVGYGIAAGIIVGAVKEYSDLRRPLKHTSSLQDLLVTAAGAAVGAYSTNWVLTYTRGQTGVAYTRSF
jgi:predicted TIM-barrel enzyme